jgi:lipid-binding SYLF domain-containing protein
MMTRRIAQLVLSFGAAILTVGVAHAASYRETISVFKDAGESGRFFSDSYAYAVFPTIGEGGLVVGGAHGKGRVYVHGRYAGAITMSQVSVGLQAGGKAFSQIIFFEDSRALQEFESGSFQFGAGASVVAITAAAGADAGTTGAAAGASAGPRDAVTAGKYQKGMVVFTVAKGGAMFDISVAGQKFAYKARDSATT